MALVIMHIQYEKGVLFITNVGKKLKCMYRQFILVQQLEMCKIKNQL